MNDLILQPILFMGLLSLVMMLLMYITRIPAAKVLEAEGVDCLLYTLTLPTSDLV